MKRSVAIINTDFQLNSDLRGIQYDRVITDGGQMPCSDMDRQIEIIFDRLDREKEQLQNEIYLNNILIRKMEWENDCMEEVLSLLDKESGSLIELKYSQKLSCEKIAERFSMSASNVSKKLKEVKRDLIKWIRYYNYQKNGNVFS